MELNIPDSEHTPLVERLLAIHRELSEENAMLKEKVRFLEDEIAVLKKQKPRPDIKPSRMEEGSGKKDTAGKADGKRSGSGKRCKTGKLNIHETRKLRPEDLPQGSRFKGYKDFVVQGMTIEAHNVLYRRECWKTPDGRLLIGKLPASTKGHFNNKLISYILYQHHQCHVTQPKLLEGLHEFGIDISTGEVNEILLNGKDAFHAEKDEILPAGLESSGYITVDDTGARHRGCNGYCTHIGNDLFAWFGSSGSKSRLNFLELLCAQNRKYSINEEAIIYMDETKLPDGLKRLLSTHPGVFPDRDQWEKHLRDIGVTNDRHIRIATEGALIGHIIDSGLLKDVAIVSDDAGQFHILLHALCWIHAERLLKKIIPYNENHRGRIESVRAQIWDLYADLKAYKKSPDQAQAEILQETFDRIFTQTTGYPGLDKALERINKNREELLLVLKRPDIPLHTNGSERDIRDYVTRRKISGGTRSDPGRQCRDTFASLKKTCRKLGISFWKYLTDRLSGTNEIPPLPDLIRQRAAARSNLRH